MAVFTIAATGILVLTLRSANKTNLAALEANEMLRSEQRPWLAIDDTPVIFLSDPFEPNNPDSMEHFKGLGFRADVRNIGLTPAVNCSFFVHLDVVDIGSPAPPIQFTYENGSGFVAQGSLRQTATKVPELMDSLKLMNGKKTAYFFARVDYYSAQNPNGTRFHTQTCTAITCIGKRTLDGRTDYTWERKPTKQHNTVT
jgi:hypothetical protein